MTDDGCVRILDHNFSETLQLIRNRFLRYERYNFKIGSFFTLPYLTVSNCDTWVSEGESDRACYEIFSGRRRALSKLQRYRVFCHALYSSLSSLIFPELHEEELGVGRGRNREWYVCDIVSRMNRHRFLVHETLSWGNATNDLHLLVLFTCSLSRCCDGTYFALHETLCKIVSRDGITSRARIFARMFSRWTNRVLVRESFGRFVQNLSNAWPIFFDELNNKS